MQENERFFRQFVSNTENISVRGTPGGNEGWVEIVLMETQQTFPDH